MKKINQLQTAQRDIMCAGLSYSFELLRVFPNDQSPPIFLKNETRRKKNIQWNLLRLWGKKISKRRFPFLAVFSNRSIHLQIWSRLIYYKIEMKERGKKAGWALALKVPYWKMHIHEFFCEVFPIPTENEAEYLSRPFFFFFLLLGIWFWEPNWFSRRSIDAPAHQNA